MTIVEQIIDAYPELTDLSAFKEDLIIVQDDSDGKGAYIAKWEYSKPIPEALKKYKR